MDDTKRQKSAEPILELEDEDERPSVSFLDMPRELREMIYRYVPENTGAFTYNIYTERTRPHWPPLFVGDCQEGVAFDDKHGNPGVALGTEANYFAILLTCRTIYSEALPIIYAGTPLGVWRPMYDYGGLNKYPNFVAKVFDSLPKPANQYISIFQIQGELWHNNMTHLLNRAIKDLPSLQILEIGLDPYYEASQRKHWFDDRKMLRQSWPAIATLHLVVQRLSRVNMTISPPMDKVHIISFNHAGGVWLSGSAYKDSLWLRLQLLVIRNELTIYGALLSGNAKAGMEFFMDRLVEGQDLFEVFQGNKLVDQCIAGTARFKLEDQREWIEEVTGRIVEVDEKERRIGVMSAKEAETKWCKMTYISSPRGLVDPQRVMEGENMAYAIAQGPIPPDLN
ncbi:hypothetical protein KCU78_g4223, partial [Aureobasidium melanogenum]